jgi:sugar phosphate isomerase/epimerase
MIEAVSRRSLLSGIIATGALTMLGSKAGAAPATTEATPFFERIGKPIGLQLYTLGDEAGRDLDATFAAVAEIGYRDIELPSLYGRKPADIAAAAQRAGLTISSLHLPPMRAPGLSLLSSPAEIAEGLGALGAKRAVAPIMLFPADFRPQAGESFPAAIARSLAAVGEDPWQRTAALLNERASALKPSGIGIGYHNHNVEFAPIGKTNGWEILVKECDPHLVGFEVDVGWVATAGRDPAAFLERYRGRVKQLHVKDVAAGNETNFAITMKPTEVGAGTLDWKRILPAAQAAGVEHFYVEQEPPFAIARMEAARRSYAFLAQLKA